MIDITTWGHATVQFERDGQRLVIDPGVLSDLSVLTSADAVLITHEHADHIAVEAVVDAIAADAELEIWCPGSVEALLADAGVTSGRIHEVSAGAEFTAAGFRVRGVGGEHALIHRSIPPVANVGYLIEETALHPGDSFAAVPDGIGLRVLFLPVSAPWLKVAESVDYLAQVSPTIAVPIHDAILSEPGRAFTDRVVNRLAGDLEYRRLAQGETLSL